MTEGVLFEDSQYIVFSWNENVSAAFRRLKIFLGRSHESLAIESVSIPKLAEIEPYASFPNGKLYSCGSFSYSETKQNLAPISVGRYCSISTDLAIFGERHPIEYVTHSSLSYDFKHGRGYEAFIAAQADIMGNAYLPVLPEKLSLGMPKIGHDVWIGQNVQLAQGISIGTGSVIAAGAVVTHDVPPYTIVGGVPAKPIRRRFDDDLCDRLLRSEWWRYSPKHIFSIGIRDPRAFLDQFEPAQAAGEIPLFDPTPVTWRTITNVLLDQVIIETNNTLSRPLLRDGWSSPEPHFTWATGDESVIVLDLADVANRRRITLDVLATPFKAQSVELFALCGGLRVPLLAEVVRESASLTFHLEDRMIDNEHITLAMRHPDSVQPCSYGFNDDSRYLSLALIRIIVR